MIVNGETAILALGAVVLVAIAVLLCGALCESYWERMYSSDEEDN